MTISKLPFNTRIVIDTSVGRLLQSTQHHILLWPSMVKLPPILSQNPASSPLPVSWFHWPGALIPLSSVSFCAVSLSLSTVATQHHKFPLSIASVFSPPPGVGFSREIL